MMWLWTLRKFGNQLALFVDLYLPTVHLACWITHIFKILLILEENYLLGVENCAHSTKS